MSNNKKLLVGAAVAAGAVVVVGGILLYKARSKDPAKGKGKTVDGPTPKDAVSPATPKATKDATPVASPRAPATPTTPSSPGPAPAPAPTPAPAPAPAVTPAPASAPAQPKRAPAPAPAPTPAPAPVEKPKPKPRPRPAPTVTRPPPKRFDASKTKVENIVVLGKPGAGKQMRADVIAQEFGLERLSLSEITENCVTLFHAHKVPASVLDSLWEKGWDWFVGDESMREILAGSGVSGKIEDRLLLGAKVACLRQHKKSIPDAVTNLIFQTVFREHAYKGLVIDGAPTGVDQAKFLQKLCRDNDVKIDAIVVVEVDNATALSRKANEAALVEYEAKTVPAISFFEDDGVPVVRVSGSLTELKAHNVRESILLALYPDGKPK